MLNIFGYSCFMPIKLFLLLLITALAYSADGEETDYSFLQISPTPILRDINPLSKIKT
jgi:hypothetical protein